MSRIRCGRRGGFTLIELLIVIGLLGGLASVVLPQFSMRRGESLDQIVCQDMAAIRDAFARLYRDAVLSVDDLERIRRHGLHPILARPRGDVGGWAIPPWEAARECGWRGPYAEQEARRSINVAAGAFGQPAGATELPVIEDPFACSSGGDGHYYRIVAPELASGGFAYGQMLLVCVGPNGTLDLTLPTLAAGESLDVEAVTAGVDDRALRLLPYVE